MTAPQEQPAHATPESHPMLRLLDRPLSQAHLAAGAESAAQPGDPRIAGAVLGLLVFRLGDETLALPAKVLRGVTPHADAIRIPHKSGSVLRGLCNIRGELILCANLRGVLGIPAPAPAALGKEGSDDRRMVMINTPDGPWAFEVDSVEGVERTPAGSVAPPPVTVKYAMAGCTAGVATIKGRGVTILDSDRVLSRFQAGLA